MIVIGGSCVGCIGCMGYVGLLDNDSKASSYESETFINSSENSTFDDEKNNDNNLSTVNESSTASNITESAKSEISSVDLNKSESENYSVPESRETAIGKSDKIFDFTISSPLSVRNDNTGKWRYLEFSESGIDISEYALDYYHKYFTSDDEIHAVINFANKTTTQISYAMGMLFVTVHEYVDGEENDANKMFSGEKLQDFIVYTDNGDIESMTEESETSANLNSIDEPEIDESSAPIINKETEPLENSETAIDVDNSIPQISKDTVPSAINNGDTDYKNDTTKPTSDIISEPDLADNNTAVTPSISVQNKSDIVYIAASGEGTKYHRSPDCSKMDGNVIEMTREEAEAAGYTPCKKKSCYG